MTEQQTKRLRAVQAAIGHLRAARDLLADAQAPKAAGKVRAALRSAGGAERHARCAPFREARQARAAEERRRTPA